MCGRYTVVNTKKLKARFNLDDTLYKELKPNYNVAPGQELPVIVHDDKGNHLKRMKWGLVPHWAKDEKIGYKMINARAESLIEKPSFKRPFLKQRCIVPANGFFEWQHQGANKTPFYIHRKDDDILSFAGLFDRWENPFDEYLYTFTIITVPPTSDLGMIHDRMPAVLPKKIEEEWLTPKKENDPKYLLSLLKPYPEELDIYQVSDKINKPKFNKPSLLNKV